MDLEFRIGLGIGLLFNISSAAAERFAIRLVLRFLLRVWCLFAAYCPVTGGGYKFFTRAPLMLA